jgi:hypothetical protein
MRSFNMMWYQLADRRRGSKRGEPNGSQSQFLGRFRVQLRSLRRKATTAQTSSFIAVLDDPEQLIRLPFSSGLGKSRWRRQHALGNGTDRYADSAVTVGAAAVKMLRSESYEIGLASGETSIGRGSPQNSAYRSQRTSRRLPSGRDWPRRYRDQTRRTADLPRATRERQ